MLAMGMNQVSTVIRNIVTALVLRRPPELQNFTARKLNTNPIGISASELMIQRDTRC